MKRCLLVAAAATLVASFAYSSWVWGAIPRVPATDTFRVLATDRIRGDGRAYIDGVGDCVTTNVQTNFFGLRSYYPPACLNVLPSMPTRTITLDFSDAVSRPAGVDCSSGPFLKDGVSICGSNDFYDVRVLANSLFAKNAPTNGTPVTVPFNPVPFSYPQFELDFEQNLKVVVINSTTRTMEASGTAVAELYEYVGGIKSSLGRYHMPFKLTVKKDW